MLQDLTLYALPVGFLWATGVQLSSLAVGQTRRWLAELSRCRQWVREGKAWRHEVCGALIMDSADHVGGRDSEGRPYSCGACYENEWAGTGFLRDGHRRRGAFKIHDLEDDQYDS